jgi:hypothetical protein
MNHILHCCFYEASEKRGVKLFLVLPHIATGEHLPAQCEQQKHEAQADDL